MKGARVFVLALTVLVIVAQSGCGGAGGSSSSPTAFPVSTVFVVVLENHSFAGVIGNPAMPYLNSLATKYGLATNYFANTHPSIGNYFMLTTGVIPTNNDGFTGQVGDDNVVRELTAAGKSWKGYFDSLPAVGYLGGDQMPYVKHHNPFAYLTDVVNSPAQQANIVPATQLAQDIAAGRLPQYGFIVPNDFENGQQCAPGITCTDAAALGAADAWLQGNLEPLLASPAFQKGIVFIVFDESLSSDTTNGGGHIAVIAAGPGAKPAFQSAAFYQHENLLRTMLQQLGVTVFPGASAGAAAMTEFIRTP